MDSKIKEHIDKMFEHELGMTYNEFELLDFYEQQRLIEQIRKKIV